MHGLELLNPKGLFLLTGLVPLVVMYILKVRRQRVRVSSTWLWAAAQRDLLAKQPFRRLIAEVPLLLQILALIALSIAFARPAIRGGRIGGDHVAIVIDSSASMGTETREIGVGGKPRTRIADARRAAHAVVSALAPGADAMVLEAAREPRLAAPLERDERHLDAAIDSVDVRDVEGDLAGSVALAADRLRSLPGSKKIVVVTDAALAHDTPLAASGVDTEVVTVGDDEDNAAIVRVDVRSSLDPTTRREETQAFAMVRNYGARPRDLFVTVSLAGSADTLASRRILVAPNEKTPVVLTFEPGVLDHGKGLVFEISPHDALAIDDVAFGRVPTSVRMPVTLATAAPYSWMERALDADPSVELRKLTLDQLASVNIEPDALVVVEGACPRAVPGGDVVIVAPPKGSCFGVDVGDVIANPQVTSWEAGDPRLRFLSLKDLLVAESAQLDARGAGASLVRAPLTTLVADASMPGRAITIVGFDVADSNWPLQASFVLFVRNVVELARVHRAQGIAGAARTGEPLRIAVPPGTPSITVDGPGMKEVEVAARLDFAIVPPLDRAGLYAVRWTAPHIGDAIIAANLTSEAESDVRPKPIAIAGGPSAGTVSASQVADAHNEWGAWLALLAAAVILLDVWWITRRARTPTLTAAPRSG